MALKLDANNIPVSIFGGGKWNDISNTFSHLSGGMYGSSIASNNTLNNNDRENDRDNDCNDRDNDCNDHDNDCNDHDNVILGGGITYGKANVPNYYPSVNDPNYTKKVIHKKEFYINRKRKIYDENFKNLLNEYIPDPGEKLMDHQKFARTIINPETPNKSALLFYDTGTGKTIACIAIAEGFKQHILNLRKQGKTAWVYIVAEHASQQRFFDDLLGPRMFGEYASYEERMEYRSLQRIPENERETGMKMRLKELRREFRSRIFNPKKNGIYKFVSFREFQNHTIGRREKQDGKTLRDENGNIIRINPVDEIKNLDNSLLIIDEAHRTEGNDWMTSIMNVIRRSKNVRIILATATPMYHLAKEIIEIVNLLSEPIDQIKEDEVFAKDTFTGFTESAEKIIKKVTNGKVLYLRGKDPELFPKIIRLGEFMPTKMKLIKSASYFGVPDDFYMRYTQLIRVPMSPFHLQTYLHYYEGKIQLDKKMLVDIVLPTPKSNYGGFDKSVIGEIHRASDDWKRKHNIESYVDDEKKIRLRGGIFDIKNLSEYSAKYARILEDMIHMKGKIIIYEELIDGLGINLFLEILIENGYTPTRTVGFVGITSTKREKQRCYHCGIQFNKVPIKNLPKDHICSPAYFSILIGTLESKGQQEQILLAYNDEANDSGINIKIILGSQVIKESIDFQCVRHLIILNYQNNFSSIKQIEGRVARNKSHIRLPPHDRNVKIYKYVSSIPKIDGEIQESAEEFKYRIQEYEHIRIKQIERWMIEGSVDCSLNKSYNVSEQEIQDSKGCIAASTTTKNKGTGNKSTGNKGTGNFCPADCQYMDCDYKCDYELAAPLDNKSIDMTTWMKHEKYEREEIKKYIKILFKLDVVWTAKGIIQAIHDSDRFEFLDDVVILDILYEFINTKQPLHNSYSTEGYLIAIDNLILFQPKGIIESLSLEERRLPRKSNEKYFISVSDYNNYKIKIGSDGEKNVVDILVSLNKFEKAHEIAKKLGELSIVVQRKILESCIEMIALNSWKTKKNKESIMKVLVNYAEYLITESQVRKSRDEYYETLSKKSLEHIDTEKIIGHFFGDSIRCLSIVVNDDTVNLDDAKKDKNVKSKNYVAKWIKCKNPISTKNAKLMKENDYIVGYIDKTKNGKIVFKLRFVKESQTDKRKETKGFVCKQHNIKQLLINIATKIGVDKDLTFKNINKICDLIELKLREKQHIENKKDKPKRYFYEYLEHIN